MTCILGLEQAVLGTRNFNEVDQMEEGEKKGVKMDAKEMEQLLREGMRYTQIDYLFYLLYDNVYILSISHNVELR